MLRAKLITRGSLLGLAAAMVLAAAVGVRAEDAPASVAKPVTSWPHWRGPNYNGTTSAMNLPDKISTETNVLWVTALPGTSSSSPVIANGHVYLTASDAAAKKLRAFSVDAATGKIEWEHEVSDVPPTNFRNSYASSSATPDAQGAIFIFGNGDMAAFDNEGKTRWSRKLSAEYGRIANDWVYSSSPLLLNDMLYVQVLQRAESFLLALNPADGKTKWRVVRPTDAVGESHDAYTSPIPLVTKEGTQILVFGGDYLTGSDPATGKELWRYGGFNPQQKKDWRVIPSPVTDGERVYIPVARGLTTLAVKTGGAGDISKTHHAWTIDAVGSDSPTPALFDGVLYVLDSGKKILTTVDAATGKAKESIRLGGDAPFSSSPTLANGKIYLLGETGEVVICSTEPLKVLSRMTLDDKGPSRSTVAAVDGKIFIRTAGKLWCFGSK